MKVLFCGLEVRRGEPYRADEQHQTRISYELFFNRSSEFFFLAVIRFQGPGQGSQFNVTFLNNSTLYYFCPLVYEKTSPHHLQ